MGQDDNRWCKLGFAEPTAVYRSGTRKARHLTEGWMAEHGFCPNCDADRLPALPDNAPVGDFRCAVCAEEYELKARQGTLGSTLQAGAWRVMQSWLTFGDRRGTYRRTL